MKHGVHTWPCKVVIVRDRLYRWVVGCGGWLRRNVDPLHWQKHPIAIVSHAATLDWRRRC